MKISDKKVAEVVVGLPVEGPFDYSINEEFQSRISVGMRVLILFNRKKMVGFVVGFKQRSAFKKLNPIIEVLDKTPSLGQSALELVNMISQYYGCSRGEAIESYLPTYLRKNKGFDDVLELNEVVEKDKKPSLQLIVDKSLTKRWVYIVEALNEVLKKSVIFLVPEIQMISDVVKKLKNEVSCEIFAFDKKLTPKNEFEKWVNIKKSDSCIVVGSRSTVFSPVWNLGLIVVYDQENDAYKQEQTPHYDANEIVRMRSEIENCNVLFVSSAPSAELWKEASKDEWGKAIIEAEKYSEVQFVDMNNYNPRKTSIISFPLQNNIFNILENNKKAVLIMNRRGFSTLTQCNQCGFVLKCPRCDINLAYMYSKKLMICRRCNYQKELPKICPECNGSYLRSIGTGIEKLESEVARLYPQARVARFDKETKKFPKDANIIIATQAIIKEKENLNMDLVAVMNFDSELNHFDFRSANKAFSLLVHLRQIAKEKLLIQTRMTDDYCLKSIKNMYYDDFYKKELKLRRELKLPPFRHLVSMILRGKEESVVLEQSKELYKLLEEEKENKKNKIEILDIHPDIMSKLRDKYRFVITLKGTSVKNMLKFVKSVLKKYKKRKGVIVTLSVD
jgi:primosomal protein N' (replication factor Y)